MIVTVERLLVKIMGIKNGENKKETSRNGGVECGTACLSSDGR